MFDLRIKQLVDFCVVNAIIKKKIIMTFYIDNIGYNDELTEGTDYYLNKDGYRVMTAKYLTERGWCCGNGCKHCPYYPKAIKGNTRLR